MVRRRARRDPGRAPDLDPRPAVEVDEDATRASPVVAETAPEPSDPDAWDPVDVPLPTYVSKSVATRGVRTIDLDSTGVWSSGRNEADSALVREAAPTEAEPDTGEQRAWGS